MESTLFKMLILVLPSSNGAFELKINSVDGQLVYFEKSFSGNEIDISGLVPAVYCLSLKNWQNIYVGKFVKAAKIL